jgi:predicted Zn finger-like uncharacterized protein
MRFLIFPCPNCGAQIIARDSADGTGIVTAKCSRCKKEFEYRDINVEMMKATVKPLRPS